MEEELVVTMDEWKGAQPPNWLTTSGVSSCIAVAAVCDERQQAWLIHSSVLGHDISQLEGMLAEATAISRGLCGKGLRFVVTGGIPADNSCKHESDLAREAVRVALKKYSAATAAFHWQEVGLLEVIFKDGRWKVILT